VTLSFGFFDTFPSGGAGDVTTALARHVDNARKAEQYGFDYYFIIEHQNAGFFVASSPAVFLATVAAVTTKIRFGAMVFQLPMHNPIRLAEDVATLDHLSLGRVEFGIGYGTRSAQYDAWGLDFRLRREMGVELMDVVRKAWTEYPLSYSGKFFQCSGALPQPTPLQKPCPPVWMGGHSQASIEYAASEGYDFAQNLDVERVAAEKFARFRALAPATGVTGKPPRTLLARHVHVAETDAQARSEAESYMLQGLQGQSGVARASALREEEKTPETLEITRVYVETARSYDFWIDEGLAFVGSPETVTRRIREQQEVCGYDILLTHHQITTMPLDLVRKSMQLFGERVIPNFAFAQRELIREAL